MTETMNVARAANKYFNDEEPWKAIKDDADRAAKSLYFCVQLVHTLSIIFAPIVPFASKKISQILEVYSNTGEANNGQETRNLWDIASYPTMEEGSPIRKPEIIFTKIEDETVEKEVEALKEASARIEAAKAKAKELSQIIDFEDFMKVKLRTATIIEAEKVKKSKKLLKLQVKIGEEQRQVVAGIAEHYEPEYLVGKTVVMVVNLKPAKIMGIESQGMILAANTDDGKLSFLSPEKAEIGSGAEVR
jgi:methionyl-tRNA synthetase